MHEAVEHVFLKERECENVKTYISVPACEKVRKVQEGALPFCSMLSKLLIVATLAVAANASLLTSKANHKAKAVACDDPSGECGEGKDCHPK